MNAPLELAIDGLQAIIHYQVALTEYECEKQIRQKAAELRRVQFICAAQTATAITVELQRCKTKLRILQLTVVRQARPEIQACWAPLFAELEQRIEELRKKR